MHCIANCQKKIMSCYLNNFKQSGGAGVGKRLSQAVTEYLKRFLRYPNQNLDQSSVLVTASTGKAATVINDIT